MTEDYINDYINSKITITGDYNDCILSCHIKYDLNRDFYVSSQKISKTLLDNKSIKKKIMRGSMYYLGIKYK
jgi:hypothetical protein